MINRLRTLFGSPRATRFYFDRIGLPYQWLTRNPLWRVSLREMSRHFPPSGAHLRVLDVGCGPGNSALQLLEFRPDLRIIGVDFAAGILRIAQQASRKVATTDRLDWIQADATYLPFPENSVDAITAHSLFYMLDDPDAFLHEVLRVLRPGGRLLMMNPIAEPYPVRLLGRAWRDRGALSVLTWHTVSRLHNRYTLEEMSTILSQAGFARVLAERAVEGHAVFSRGEKPYTARSTVERIAQTAALDESSDSLQSIDAAALQATVRGKFIFVLVRQTPDKPAWDLQPSEVVRWQAAMVNDQMQPYMLAFSTLPKAVAFMQPAVTSGTLRGINKIAKFDKTVALEWGTDLMLNPPLNILRDPTTYTFNGVQLDLDPSRAVTGEE